ncbi:MAG: helix-turn-helix domain-containing protein, partial [Burkholderiales bacterium]
MFAVVPIDEYQRLVAQAARASDVAEVRRLRRARRAGRAQTVPASVVDRRLSGAAVVRVWREHRGLSVRGLAEAAGISAPYVSQIEAGRRRSTVAVLVRLADAPSVDLDDLAWRRSDAQVQPVVVLHRRARRVVPAVRQARVRVRPVDERRFLWIRLSPRIDAVADDARALADPRLVEHRGGSVDAAARDTEHRPAAVEAEI